MAKNYTAWPPNWPKSQNYPGKPVYNFLEQTVNRVPDRLAIIFSGMELTYSDLKHLADRFAAALESLGVKKGDRVSINLINCPQFAIAYYGHLSASGKGLAGDQGSHVEQLRHGVTADYPYLRKEGLGRYFRGDERSSGKMRASRPCLCASPVCRQYGFCSGNSGGDSGESSGIPEGIQVEQDYVSMRICPPVLNKVITGDIGPVSHINE